MSDSDPPLLEFPCEFAIKAMGSARGDFRELVVGIVATHVGELDDGAVRERTSRNGRYLAVTVTVRASSKAQLDAIYHDLSHHERVLMAL